MRLNAEMNRLEKLINELESKISKMELVNQATSKASVGWHIEHTLLTFNLITNTLKKSNPNNYKWKFNFTRFFVFTINKIPRRRAQSPTSVLPANDFNIETLKTHIGIAKEKLKELNFLKPDNYFEHPFFGKLNLKPSIKFLELHTTHHIKIINDIIKAEKL